jgi:hypothetical protein
MPYPRDLDVHHDQDDVFPRRQPQKLCIESQILSKIARKLRELLLPLKEDSERQYGVTENSLRRFSKSSPNRALGKNRLLTENHCRRLGLER